MQVYAVNQLELIVYLRDFIDKLDVTDSIYPLFFKKHYPSRFHTAAFVMGRASIRDRWYPGNG